MISTRNMALLANQRHCEMLGVDEFKIDWEATTLRPAEVVEVETSRYLWMEHKHEKKFRAPVARWRIGDRWFTVAVPVETEKHVRSSILESHVTFTYDHPAMEEKLIQYVEESKLMLNNP